MRKVWTSTANYCVCDRCARPGTYRADVFGKLDRQEPVEACTLVCSQCDVYMPAGGANYRPTQTEIIMSEFGLIQDRDTRPTVDERAAFRRIHKANPPGEFEDFTTYSARLHGLLAS